MIMCHLCSWENLFYSIIGILQFNRFAIPHVGAGDAVQLCDVFAVNDSNVTL